VTKQFDPAKHPRGGATNVGRFAAKTQEPGDASLSDDVAEDPAWQVALDRTAWFGNTPNEDDARNTIAQWRSARAAFAERAGPDPAYVYFASEADAAAIAETGELFASRTVEGGVFAAAVGGKNVPEVQHSMRDSGGGLHDESSHRKVAVVFRCDELPDNIFPEEVIWRRNQAVGIRVDRIVPAADAETMLDNSLKLPSDGL
jgi:hypothetical protein